ncbi:hypothetical protein DPMN_053781 [Dreissena polymorpha]|uniref:Uncharacterized protein n=1 Tax=Dreissena polymorpha TaxID=45954 RepID=A0A9D4CPF5_DREPO|nr:hypothetical protein DPMN_053781 [Dreissena polymorpha]
MRLCRYFFFCDTSSCFYGNSCCDIFISRECTAGGFCNFMYLKPISRELRRELYLRSKKTRKR